MSITTLEDYDNITNEMARLTRLHKDRKVQRLAKELDQGMIELFKIMDAKDAQIAELIKQRDDAVQRQENPPTIDPELLKSLRSEIKTLSEHLAKQSATVNIRTPM